MVARECKVLERAGVLVRQRGAIVITSVRNLVRSWTTLAIPTDTVCGFTQRGAAGKAYDAGNRPSGISSDEHRSSSEAS